MTEPNRIKRNQDRLKELFPSFAKRIGKIIADLESAGVRPRIQEAFRSPADQLKAFNGGFSKLKFGFHNVTDASGNPESLAVDLLDDDRPLTPTSGYLLRLAAVVQKHGLETGILWGLPAKLQLGVTNAIAAGDFTSQVKVGWDPTHIQPTDVTIAEAKSGKRPA